MSVLNRASAEDQSQERRGQDHVRTFDPDAYQLLGLIYQELLKLNAHMAILTDEEEINDED